MRNSATVGWYALVHKHRQEPQNTMAAADVVTEQYAAAMNEAISAAATAEAKAAQLEARVADLQAAFDAVSQAASDACGGKAFDLYWLGRRNVEEAMNGPGADAITRIRQAYPTESERLIDARTPFLAAWEKGFWAGTVSFARLINGLAVTNETMCDVDTESDEEPMTAAELRAAAHDEYPRLDS